jgi:ATP-dependent RNA helicase RhlE
MNFRDLQLIEPVLQALHEEGYTNPTPIQKQAIPPLLQHRDLLGCAQTGTGKTAAFAIPILQLMSQLELEPHGKRPIRALVLTPTRELAIQIEESFRAYGRHLKLRPLVIFGGVSQVPQVQQLHRGVDILIATPGRLLDLLNQKQLTLEQIRFFVLDEADRMLDMGFVHDVRRVIAKLPTRRQTLFFSATMPAEIQQLADKILHEPVRVEVAPVSSTADTVQQYIYQVDKTNKVPLLVHIMKDPAIRTALVFSRTKHGADRIAKSLNREGIRAAAIHGDKSQGARQTALSDFKAGKLRILVATDIAARGIDIDELGHVINYDLPNVPETYVHRIGRTGRAGASGKAFSFCDAEEKAYLRDIEKLIRKKVPLVEDHPYPMQQMQETRSTASTQGNQRNFSGTSRPQNAGNRNQPVNGNRRGYGNGAGRQEGSRNQGSPANPARGHRQGHTQRTGTA